MITKVITPESSVNETINHFRDILKSHYIEIDHIEYDRPWGGEIWVKNSFTKQFQSIYFSDTQFVSDDLQGPATPKLLIVKPGGRLSWQYHKRRQEIWRVVQGPIGTIMSDSNTMTDPSIFTSGSIIQIGIEMRHRLIGLDNWGVVAEIWKHNDPANISNEDDIIRLQDDYGR
ncbi:MAG: phosphoheptose isomerase [bacterium]|nr:phosphoheptose isomerase [bacterium]